MWVARWGRISRPSAGGSMANSPSCWWRKATPITASARKRSLRRTAEILTGLEDPCRCLSQQEVAAQLAAGKPYVIRQKIPHTGTTTFSDASFGEITVENSTLDDQVLMKRDGLPTY